MGKRVGKSANGAYLKAPFPWYGGKSRVAHLVWRAFGEPGLFIEPFFGSGAVLLKRPDSPSVEIVNDKDGLVVNFWRAVKHDSITVTEYAEQPLFESELHARHAWIVGQLEDLVARIEGDVDFYDAELAGYWAWGLSSWVGSGWCDGKGPWKPVKGRLVKREQPGIIRKRPHIGNSGRGVNRKCADLSDWLEALSSRLSDVRVMCGDWKRVVGDGVMHQASISAVFLDPPYDDSLRTANLYREEMSLSDEVREWAVKNGDKPGLRIALCGLEGEHEMPKSWHKIKWSNYGEASNKSNADQERIWFSPHCLKDSVHDLPLFESMG